MRQFIYILFLSSALLLSAAGCGGGDDHGHTHGEDGDHTHEQPTQQAQEQEDHGHAHDGEDAHTHDEGTSTAAQSGEEEQVHRHEDESTQTHEHEQGATETESSLEGAGVITQWTDKTELFMEYPALIVGQEATFAVHLTRLSDFAPLQQSTVHFLMKSENGATLSVTEDQVQIPGIYGPDFTFEQAGRYDLTITIEGMVADTLHIHGIPVYATAAEVPHTHEEEDPNLISFLKEQQWNIPFGTQKVGRRTLSETVDAHGELKPVQSRDVVVSAPFSGIMLSSSNQNLPVVGQEINQGRSLVRLHPTIQSAGGENYARQFMNAQSELTLARKDLERSKRLYEKEAIPQWELEKARVAYRQARTRFQTINEIARVDTASIDIYGESESSYRFEMKAPVAGTVMEWYVQPGMQVKAGEPLVRIADMSRMWLSVHVPAAERSAIENPGAAVFYVQGNDRMYGLKELNGQLISAGKQVDPQTRTLSLIYEIDNGESLQSGLFVTAEIDTRHKKKVLAIPESALIEEEGNFVVYLHLAGESFEKRSITTGIRNRGMVEVTSGLDEGEHIVTKNAYRIKLASLSSEAPAHGHAH